MQSGTERLREREREGSQPTGITVLRDHFSQKIIWLCAHFYWQYVENLCAVSRHVYWDGLWFFQPVCQSSVVCPKWSAGVLWKFKVSLFSRANEGWTPVNSMVYLCQLSKNLWCALTILGPSQCAMSGKRLKITVIAIFVGKPQHHMFCNKIIGNT